MASEKITKMEMFDMLQNIVESSEAEIEMKEQLIDFIENEKRILEKKKERARENADKKRSAGDDLQKAVYDVLTADGQSADAIVEQISMENVTKQKVIARLTQLAKMGKVAKDVIKDNDRQVTLYKLAEQGE